MGALRRTVLAGACGGALAGVLEAAVVTVALDSSERWPGLHLAVTGALVGGVICVPVALTRRPGLAAGLAFALVAANAARFEVRALTQGSAPAWILPAALLLVAVGAAALARWMERGRPVVVLAGTLLATGAWALSEPDAADALDLPGGEGIGPPVVVLLVDTLRADRIGGSLVTPALDRLAADGTVFQRAYAHASWTRPSVASLFCSCLPSEHGVGAAGRRLDPSWTTLAEAFRDAGWHTAALFNNINVSSVWGMDQGFDAVVYRGPAYPWGGSALVSRTSLYGMALGRLRGSRVNPSVPVHYYRPAKDMFDDALRYVDRREGGRWLLYVHLMEPHSPYFEDGSTGARWDALGGEDVAHDLEAVAELQALYDSEVVAFDRALGAFLDALDARGLYDGATIVLLSDHGEEFHEHGGLWHGATLFDELVRVPLIVKPAGGRPGARADVVRLVDVAPSLTGSVGVPSPPSWRGIDLFGPPGDREVLFENHHEREVLRGVVDRGLKLILAEPGNRRGFPRRSMYDLVADPGELHDGAAADPERARALEALVPAIAGGAPPRVSVDATTREQLERLGYVGE